MRETAKRISLRLNGAEYAHLKQLSANTGLKMEPVLRRLIMGAALKSRPPDELPRLLELLSAVAADIHQIAGAAGGVSAEDMAQIQTMQRQLWQEVKRL